MNKKIISSLIDVLKKEYEYHQKLCDSALSKKKAIIENEIEELTDIINEEKILLNDLDELENERNQVLNNLAQEYDFKENPPQYNLLKEKLPDKYKQDLKNIRDKLLEVIEELQKINEQNKVLLQEAVKLNNFSFDLMAEVLEPQTNVYGNDEENDDENKTQHIMDRKA